MKIKEKFLWDYDFSPEERKSKDFKRWYFSRVLTRGNLSEVRDLGYNNIKSMLPTLNLPNKVRTFWNFFFQNESQ